MMISVKRALVSDAATISFLGKKTFTETFANLFNREELNEYLNTTFSIMKLENSLSISQNIFGVLYYENEPVGYYKIKVGLGYDNLLSEKCCQLRKIYILK
jgi:diamine N-acetyltransferase